MNPKIKSNYTRVPNVIIRDPRFTAYERLVLIYILQFDECFAGQGTIARVLGVSRSTIQRAIARLLKMNVLRKSQRDGWSVSYLVNKRSDWSLEGDQ